MNRNEELTQKLFKKYLNFEIETDKQPNIKVYDWLNGDNFWGFYTDGKTAWFELITGYCPNYIHDFLVKFIKKNGYKYLYDN